MKTPDGFVTQQVFVPFTFRFILMYSLDDTLDYDVFIETGVTTVEAAITQFTAHQDALGIEGARWKIRPETNRASLSLSDGTLILAFEDN